MGTGNHVLSKKTGIFFRATETNGRAKERSGLLSENQVVLPNLLFSNNRLLTAL